MADRNVIEDSKTGQLTLRDTSYTRYGWWLLPLLFALFGATGLLYFLLPLPFFAAFALYRSFADDTITVDRQSRMLTRDRGLLFFRLTPTRLPFSQIANIKVQHYQTGRNGTVTRWRVNAIDLAGNKFGLISNGEKDEMFSLAHRIASFSGAPLLGDSKNVSLPQRIMGQSPVDAPAGSENKVPGPEAEAKEVPARDSGAASIPRTETPAANPANAAEVHEPAPADIPEPKVAQ